MPQMLPLLLIGSALGSAHPLPGSWIDAIADDRRLGLSGSAAPQSFVSMADELAVLKSASQFVTASQIADLLKSQDPAAQSVAALASWEDSALTQYDILDDPSLSPHWITTDVPQILGLPEPQDIFSSRWSYGNFGAQSAQRLVRALGDDERGLVVSHVAYDRSSDLAARILEFAALEPGWDGYRGRPPTHGTVNSALQFLDLIPAGLPAPTATVAGDGELGFVWHEPNRILDVGIDSSGDISYYGEIDGTEWIGSEQFHRAALPPQLSAAFAALARV